jgi:hypothetical protein
MTLSVNTVKTNREILNEIKSNLHQISLDTDHDDYEHKRRKIIKMTHQLYFPRHNDLNALLVTKSFLERLNDFHPSTGSIAEKTLLIKDVTAMSYYLEHL